MSECKTTCPTKNSDAECTDHYTNAALFIAPLFAKVFKEICNPTNKNHMGFITDTLAAGIADAKTGKTMSLDVPESKRRDWFFGFLNQNVRAHLAR